MIVDGPFVDKFPIATDSEPLALILDAQIPPETKNGGGIDSLVATRDYFLAEAKRFLDALQAHAPGGFVDAIFGELAHRKASLFHVACPPNPTEKRAATATAGDVRYCACPPTHGPHKVPEDCLRTTTKPPEQKVSGEADGEVTKR